MVEEAVFVEVALVGAEDRLGSFTTSSLRREVRRLSLGLMATAGKRTFVAQKIRPQSQLA